MISAQQQAPLVVQVGKSQLLTMDEFRAYKQKREESIGLSSSIVLFTL